MSQALARGKKGGKKKRKKERGGIRRTYQYIGGDVYNSVGGFAGGGAYRGEVLRQQRRLASRSNLFLARSQGYGHTLAALVQ